MLKIGNLVEVLEPKDKSAYPYRWIKSRDEYVGTKQKIKGVFLDGDRIVYQFYGSGFTWDESNLKVISRETDIQTIDVNETVYITDGEYAGETDTVLSSYKPKDVLYYALQRLGNAIPSEYIVPVKPVTSLF